MPHGRGPCSPVASPFTQCTTTPGNATTVPDTGEKSTHNTAASVGTVFQTQRTYHPVHSVAKSYSGAKAGRGQLVTPSPPCRRW